jgi:hypothetical protein
LIPTSFLKTLIATSVRFQVPRYTIPLKSREDSPETNIGNSQTPFPDFLAIVYFKGGNHPILHLDSFSAPGRQIFEGVGVELLLRAIDTLVIQLFLEGHHHRDCVILVNFLKVENELNRIGWRA